MNKRVYKAVYYKLQDLGFTKDEGKDTANRHIKYDLENAEANIKTLLHSYEKYISNFTPEA